MIFTQGYRSLVLFSYFTLFATQGYAFQLSGEKWPEPNTTFHVELGTSVLSTANTAFETAMAKWSSATAFTYFIEQDSVDPCQTPLPLDGGVTPANGVKFSSTNCGDAFGSTTIAIALTWPTLGNSSIILQSGIIFNINKTWNVYSGPWKFDVNDFRRVAVHELGHSLGLNHEDTITSIMATFASDLETPQLDDIKGVGFIYGDIDIDGIADTVDNCLNNSNPSQTDSDN
ncbi:MAG: matrixin family metalloprotease, partial [Proteobacteria bacterium]|nr:matrixin family metalloprotease [Pseudomonadota bacterium]